MGAAGVNNPQDFNKLCCTFFMMKMNPHMQFVNGMINPFFMGGFPNQNMNINMNNNFCNNFFNNNMMNNMCANNLNNNYLKNNFMQNNSNFGNNMNMVNNMNMQNNVNVKNSANFITNMNMGNNMNVNNSANFINNMNMQNNMNVKNSANFINNMNMGNNMNMPFNYNKRYSSDDINTRNNMNMNNYIMGNNMNMNNNNMMGNNINVKISHNMGNNMGNNMNMNNNNMMRNNVNDRQYNSLLFMNNLNNMFPNNNNFQMNNFMMNNNMNKNCFNMNNMNNNIKGNLNNNNNMQMNNMNNLCMNNMNMNMNNMNNMNMANNCPQIFNDLNNKFMGLSLNQQNSINSTLNLVNTQFSTNVQSNLSTSQVDLNAEIKMEFKFLTGQREIVKGKLNEIFYEVWKRFHENQCPEELKNFMCRALHNAQPIDNKKSLFDNNIKDGDIISFFVIDEDYNKHKNEDNEKEEEEEEEEEDDEKDKVIMGWIIEFKCELMLNLLGKILLEPDGEEIDTRISSDNKQLLSFLNKKFHEIGMKVDDHEHKLIYTKTNFDWKCNECEQKKLKEESRIYCSICDYNMCNECRKNKNYYKIGNIPKNVKPDNKKVRAQFIQHKGHEHRLAYCRTKRTAGHGGWYCNICRSDNSNKVWTFYCTSCDYDLCCKCAKKEKLI